MAAKQAVFSTFELIDAILKELNPFERGTAVLVCRSWREVIGQSSTITSLEMVVHEKYPANETTIPTYPKGSQILFHHTTRGPGQRQKHHYRNYPSAQQGTSGNCVKVSAFTFHGAMFYNTFRAAESSEYLTHPPVSAVYVDFGAILGESMCSLHSEDGIRVGDLQRVIRKVMRAKQHTAALDVVRVKIHERT